MAPGSDEGRRRDAHARAHACGDEVAARKSASSETTTSARAKSHRGSSTRPKARRAPSHAPRRDAGESKCTTTSPLARTRPTRSATCGALVGRRSTCVLRGGAAAPAIDDDAHAEHDDERRHARLAQALARQHQHVDQRPEPRQRERRDEHHQREGVAPRSADGGQRRGHADADGGARAQPHCAADRQPQVRVPHAGRRDEREERSDGPVRAHGPKVPTQ